jgi:hypothetical protein
VEPIRIFRSAEQLVFDDEPEKLEKLAAYLTSAPLKFGSITETPEGRVSVTTPPHPLTGNLVPTNSNTRATTYTCATTSAWLYKASWAGAVLLHKNSGGGYNPLKDRCLRRRS